MMRSLWISKTGMEAQQTQLDVISNNLANVGTNGFKRVARGVRGPDVPEPAPGRRATAREQTQLPTGLQVGLGVRAVATARNFTPGQPAADRQPARRRDQRQRLLPGADARRHHRLHARRLVPGQRQGQLVTTSGYPVQPGITIPANAQSVTIGNDGTVSVTLPGQAAPQTGRPDAARQLRQSGRPGAARARTSTPRPRPRARRTPARRARTAWARCSRATSRPRTSTSSRSWCR